MIQRQAKRTQQDERDNHTLVKYLVAAGLGSRRNCASLIFGGYVHVNGSIAGSLSYLVKQLDRVEIEGRLVQVRRRDHAYHLAHKPDGYLSAVKDDRGRPTIMDMVPRAWRVAGLVPAGRLDLHSTGLILLTDDGELVNRVTHPRYHLEKEYHVTLSGMVSPSAARQLRNGVDIQTGTAKAIRVRRLHSESGFRYSIILEEGRKREVRLMFRAIGREVLKLQRVRIGNLSIEGIKEGEVRNLTRFELQGLRRLVGMGSVERNDTRSRRDASMAKRKVAKS